MDSINVSKLFKAFIRVQGSPVGVRGASLRRGWGGWPAKLLLRHFLGLGRISWYRVSKMSIMGRILLLILLNLLGIAFLVLKLVKVGNTYSQAMRIAWNWIIADQSFANSWSVSPQIAWVSLLRKTWWVTLLIFFLFWIIAPEIRVFDCIVIALSHPSLLVFSGEIGR